jgi:hypothetical protein
MLRSLLTIQPNRMPLVPSDAGDWHGNAVTAGSSRPYWRPIAAEVACSGSVCVSVEDLTTRRETAVMDPTKIRFRFLIGVLLAAVVTAAVLRHVIHTYGGISREDIRTVSLIALAAIFVVVLFFVRRKSD